MFFLPIALILTQSALATDTEKNIQKQLDLLGREIIFSLSDCEKESFNAASKEFMIWWLSTRLHFEKQRFSDEKISISISDDMLEFLRKKYNLLIPGSVEMINGIEKYIASDSFIYELKTGLAIAAAVNIFIYQECSIDNAINDYLYHSGWRLPSALLKIKANKISHTIPTKRLSKLPEIEFDIQKQIETITAEIFISLSDCEKEFLFLYRVPYFFRMDWLSKTKYSRFAEKINNAINDEMQNYLFKKYKLKQQDFNNFKLIFVISNIPDFKFNSTEITLDDAIERTCGYFEYLKTNQSERLMKIKKILTRMDKK